MSQQGNEECGWVTVSCRRKNKKSINMSEDLAKNGTWYGAWFRTK